jgi:hypothetical protein
MPDAVHEKQLAWSSQIWREPFYEKAREAEPRHRMGAGG